MRLVVNYITVIEMRHYKRFVNDEYKVFLGDETNAVIPSSLFFHLYDRGIIALSNINPICFWNRVFGTGAPLKYRLGVQLVLI